MARNVEGLFNRLHGLIFSREERDASLVARQAIQVAVMRVSETQTRSGYFWLPSDAGDVLPGALTIRDGGKVDLEVLGHFRGCNPIGPDTNIGRIIGSVEKHGYVTLDECFYRTWSLSSPGSISKSSVFVQRAFLGIGFDADEAVTVDELRFSIEGLGEWLELSGIQMETDLAKRTATISYVPQEEITMELKNGLRLGFFLSYTLPGSANISETKITQRAFIRLKAKEPRPIDEFTALAHQLTNFLCFAIDKTVSLSAVGASTMSTPPRSRRPTRATRHDSRLPESSVR
jgi:hypothetical protein